MKGIILLTLLSVIVSSCICCTGNDLKVLNIDYVQSSTGAKIHQAFKFANMTLKFHVINEANPDETVFKFIWNYSSEDEKTKGHDLVQKLQLDFDEMREDNGFLIVFMGKHIADMPYYRESEFGSTYILQITQKEVSMELQFQIKKDQENQAVFHQALEKVLEKRKQPKELLQFLS